MSGASPAASPRREDRLSGAKPTPDQRGAFQLDRDRILYSMEFRRLAGVTQVVSPVEGEIFHSRLTHTLKVAQVARRIAEMLLAREATSQLARAWGEIDADVVEAASLAHDLGHPPFGHIAEHELNLLVAETVIREKHGLALGVALPDASVPEVARTEGYEGNAQSFRLITALSVRRPGSTHGLDLTRATLNAALKYPWQFSVERPKYGVYAVDAEAFNFARALSTPAGEGPSIEAQIMDWADDIAYSVHDVEDFYRAGRIPLDRLRSNPRERLYFRERAMKRRKRIEKPFPLPYEDVPSVLDRFLDVYVDIERPYDGTRDCRERLYACTSTLIHTFIHATDLKAPDGGSRAITRSEMIGTQVELLKEMIWCYVIYNPSLGGHQHGQRQVIRTIFDVLNHACISGRDYLLPPFYKNKWEELLEASNGIVAVRDRARLVADAVSSMTDEQALRFFQRLTASAQGSVLDPIVN
jgi:dGTPase